MLAGLLAVAFALRVYGLNWDQGLFFHPDERQILMVVERISIPANLRVLLSAQSPLNPNFFAYGSFPIYLLRMCSWLLSLRDGAWAGLSRFYLVGRALSAFFDTLTVYATFSLANKVYGRRAAVLAAALVTCTVLHIQLAHFYTVDTLLTTLVLLAVGKAVDVARGGRLRDGRRLGVLFGMALATKISILPLGLVAVVAWWVAGQPAGSAKTSLRTKLGQSWSEARQGVLHTLGTALVCFVLLQPYAVLDASRFFVGVGQEIAMAQGWYDFPYTRQYAGTWPYLYQARQILLFGMGLPLGLLGVSGLLWLVVRVVRQAGREEMVLLAWPLLYALMQGAAYAKFIRYTLPLLPFLCLAGAAMWSRAWGKAASVVGLWRRPLRSLLYVVLLVVLLGTAFQALAFLNVYRESHPWIQASVWLCQHMPTGSTLLTEEWDDPLPAERASGGAECVANYTTLRADMYAPDTEAKLEELLDAIEAADYIVLSSQRLYGSIVRLQERYALTSRYYQRLFAEQLGFQLVAAPAVYPRLAGVTLVDNPRAGLSLATPPLLADRRLPGLVLDLGRADESFTVYDHPQPLIFARTARLARGELAALLKE